MEVGADLLPAPSAGDYEEKSYVAPSVKETLSDAVPVEPVEDGADLPVTNSAPG